jgi:small nuclear ribonucleoprotein (snRNP)-like protein
MAGSYGQLDASAKSLLCLLKGLETYRTTIELRNEIVIKGKINHVDEKMNTTITEATYKLLDVRERMVTI